MITQVDENTSQREFDEFIDNAFIAMCISRDKSKYKVTYDDVKQELIFYYIDGTADKFKITQIEGYKSGDEFIQVPGGVIKASESNSKRMTCLINQENFQNLKKDSEIIDNNNKVWIVVVANCEEPGKYPTHLFRHLLNNVDVNDYVFHDGTHIRFLDDKNKGYSVSAICGDFEGNVI